MFYDHGDNNIIHISYKEELRLEKERLKRREEAGMNRVTSEAKMRPFDFYSGNTVIDEEKNIEAGFNI